ncbi:hypothetical protein D6D01_06444 [Aureobasidium pullulans]|uniref:Uncharacterized protein n=1 Tax=Aureobasidium pullulans TaxID=5580 RepID=A0A4S9L0Q1_AURPU|nr:hypothetical protein D6D01_06444 [Aureobasidium pullulans]
MRASNILVPMAAAGIVAGSPLDFQERAANTCTIKSIQSVVTKLNPSVATPYCQSLLKISTKTVNKTVTPSVPSKVVKTATVSKTVTSTKIFIGVQDRFSLCIRIALVIGTSIKFRISF